MSTSFESPLKILIRKNGNLNITSNNTVNCEFDQWHLISCLHIRQLSWTDCDSTVTPTIFNQNNAISYSNLLLFKWKFCFAYHYI